MFTLLVVVHNFQVGRSRELGIKEKPDPTKEVGVIRRCFWRNATGKQ
jgi:hypothetical protein